MIAVATHCLTKSVHRTLVGTTAVLFAMPCLAGLSATDVKERLTKDAAECTSAGTRLQIERFALVGAREHNRVRRSMGAKADGREGQRYVAVFVRQGKQVASVASIGPVEPTVRAEELTSLRGTMYCDRDEH